jgi:hypothetical protein
LDLPAMLAVAALGAAIAGVYGAIHDQITYAISPEYFTNLKFKQFHYADFGLGRPVFVSTIGVLATWWVGLVIAWLLARRLIPQQPRAIAYRQIGWGFACVFGCALTAGTLAYAYGLSRGPDADYSGWTWAFERFNIQDRWAFVRVAYIHNAGYFGGLLGLIAALLAIRPRPSLGATQHE